MTRPQALVKVRKLRALAAAAGNRQEAETAAGKAWELMRQHNIGEADLTVPSVKEPAKNGQRQRRPTVPAATSETIPTVGTIEELLVNLLRGAGQELEHEVLRALRGTGRYSQ